MESIHVRIILVSFFPRGCGCMYVIHALKFAKGFSHILVTFSRNQQEIPNLDFHFPRYSCAWGNVFASWILLLSSLTLQAVLIFQSSPIETTSLTILQLPGDKQSSIGYDFDVSKSVKLFPKIGKLCHPRSNQPIMHQSWCILTFIEVPCLPHISYMTTQSSHFWNN